MTSVGLLVRAAKFNIMMSSEYFPCFQRPVLLLLLQSFSLELLVPKGCGLKGRGAGVGRAGLGLALERSVAPFPGGPRALVLLELEGPKDCHFWESDRVRAAPDRLRSCPCPT